MTDEIKITKAELLDRIEPAWEELINLVKDLDDPTMTRINPESGWAVVDHLNHLAAWVRGIGYLLTSRSRYEGMGINAEQWRELTLDEVNHVIQRRGRRRTPAEAIENLRAAHAEFLDGMAPLNDEDLMRDYSHYDPAEPEAGQPIISWIIGNTLEHYKEHSAYIRRTIAY